MRKLKRVKAWHEVFGADGIDKSVICTVHLHKGGYEFLKGKYEVLTEGDDPVTYRVRHNPAEYPELVREEHFDFASRFVGGPFLVPRKEPAKWGVVSHDPLTLSGLHIEFASIRTAQDVIQFANRYGMLGYCYALKVPGSESVAALGESLPFWLHHVGQVRLFRALWQLVEAVDNAKLDRYVNRSTEPDSLIFTEEAYREFANEFTLRSQRTYFEGTYSSGLTFARPQPIDDSPASQLAHTGIVSTLNFEIQEATRVFVSPPDPGPYIAVTDLLGAIYWQLAGEMMGSNPVFKYCQHCQGVIHDARANAKYCSDTCRQKAFQLKKKQGNQS